MRFLTQLSRILVGALFVFSGFIKANDPLGFSYKLNEYWEVFGMEWLTPFSLFLAIFICIFEIVVGFSLLLGSRVKATLWLLLLMIVFFTFLTFYSAYFNKVTSCGCFGDAIPLTPWQSFTKDLVLLVFILILFIGQKNISPVFGSNLENFLMLVFTVAATAFPIYTFNYLPIIDFRPYAIGKNIPEQMKGIPDQLKYYYTLKNKKTSEPKEFDKFPDNYELEWDFVSSRTEVVKKGIDPKVKDFTITSIEGEDITEQILSDPGYTFLLVAYDLDKTNEGVQGRINDFVTLCQKDKVKFIGLTATSAQKINEVRHQYQSMFNYYNTDGTVLKTMIRSNPGLMLIKGGFVIDMWHFHSFPAYNDVKAKYFNK